MKSYSKRLANLEMTPARCEAIGALACWVYATDPIAVDEWLADDDSVQRWLKSPDPLEGLTPRMVEVMNQAPGHIMAQLAAVRLAKPLKASNR